MNHLVCGRMKQGKTSLAIHLGKKMSGAVVAFDQRHMINGLTVYSADELADAIENEENKKAGIVIVYRYDSGGPAENFKEMCKVLFPPRFTVRNFALVVDEAKTLQGSNWINPDLDRVITQHPRSVEIIQTTHSLQDWYRSSRDLVSDLYCFNLVGKSLNAFVDFCDGDEKMATAIRNLPPHHYLHWNQPSNTWKIVGEPEKWYAPSVEDDSRSKPSKEKFHEVKKYG